MGSRVQCPQLVAALGAEFSFVKVDRLFVQFVGLVVDAILNWDVVFELSNNRFQREIGYLLVGEDCRYPLFLGFVPLKTKDS